MKYLCYIHDVCNQSVNYKCVVIRNINPVVIIEKSILCQHVLEHNHAIYWENVKILKYEPHVHRRRTAGSFLIKQKAKKFNVLNRNELMMMDAIYLGYVSRTKGTSPSDVVDRNASAVGSSELGRRRF